MRLYLVGMVVDGNLHWFHWQMESDDIDRGCQNFCFAIAAAARIRRRRVKMRQHPAEAKRHRRCLFENLNHQSGGVKENSRPQHLKTLDLEYCSQSNRTSSPVSSISMLKVLCIGGVWGGWTRERIAFIYDWIEPHCNDDGVVPEVDELELGQVKYLHLLHLQRV